MQTRSCAPSAQRGQTPGRHQGVACVQKGTSSLDWQCQVSHHPTLQQQGASRGLVMTPHCAWCCPGEKPKVACLHLVAAGAGRSSTVGLCQLGKGTVWLSLLIVWQQKPDDSSVIMLAWRHVGITACLNAEVLQLLLSSIFMCLGVWQSDH